MKKERKIDRLDKYMEVNGLNDNKITIDLGLSVGTIGKSRKEGRDLSTKVIEKILNFYTDINSVWFLTGDGEMLRSDQVSDPLIFESQPVALQTSIGITMEYLVSENKKKDAEIEKLTKERDDALRQLREQGKQSTKAGAIPSEDIRRS